MKTSPIGISFLLIMLLSGCVNNQQGHLESQYKYGILEFVELHTIDEPTHIAGKRAIVESKIIKTADRIKVKRGRAFGIEFDLPEFFRNREVLVKQVIEFPGGGLTNPKTKKTSQKVVLESIDYDIGEPYLLAYNLEQSWEMKKGKWKFSVFLNEREFIMHEFTLY